MQNLNRDKVGDPVLVTGGAGFIGSHLVEALVLRGHRVRVIDDLSSGRLENLSVAQASGAVEFVRGTVQDEGLLTELLEGCATVFHLAASVGVGAVTARPLECFRNNLEGFQALFRALEPHAARLRRVVVFSSSEVYGRAEEGPLREDQDFVIGPSGIPRWSYAAAKAAGEFLALAEHRERQIPVTIIRCFNTCGPRQRPTYGMVVPRFLDQAMRGEDLTVYGDGTQCRCFSFVGDVVRGVLSLAEHGGAVGEVFNLGSDQETTVESLARTVIQLTGSRSGVQHLSYETVYGRTFQDVHRRVPDLSKARSLVGYEPAVDLDGILRATLAHRSQPIPAAR